MEGGSYRTVQIGVSKFWEDKHAREASKNWDKFYKRNKTNFYRDRHWTTDAATDGFPCLLEAPRVGESQVVVVEAGCGVANCAFPLIDVNPALFVYAFDFAPSAIHLIRESKDYQESKCCAFVWDFCKDPLTVVEPGERPGLNNGVADYCMLIFVLSAVPPEKQLSGLKNLFSLLKPGGRLLFRDYATGDMAQSRFASRSRINENYFVRQDSTLSYFFDETLIDTLLTTAGFHKQTLRRVHRVVTNRKEEKEMHRVFLQATYIKH